MTAGAVEALLGLSGGYPYAIQVAGHFAGRASHDSDTITVEHVRAAHPRITADLDQLVVSRCCGEHLSALAAAEALDAAPNGGHVAAVPGERVTAVSYLRDRLMKKGTIHRDGAGGLSFITPGMGDGVRRRDDRP